MNHHRSDEIAMNSPLKLLVIEDVPADFLLLERYLRQHGLDAECRRVDSEAELDAALQNEWDVVLSDYNVPGMDFRATLQRIQALRPDLPVILVSGSVGEETAVELLRLGLSDFVLKDNLARLPSAIRRALDEVNERRARRVAETACAKVRRLPSKSSAKARLAALNLMEDALAARARAEAAHAGVAGIGSQIPSAGREFRRLHLLARSGRMLQIRIAGLRTDFRSYARGISGRSRVDGQALSIPDDRATYRQALADSLMSMSGDIRIPHLA